ncbi:3-hydroxyacyl-CoA dehydrogenase/enoyl-CoA hydratase family protein [Halorientalis litorea]|uniref:3-hydroxyacyl-CoA dehydrogenase/enoyl-CoA hydratase family protein n=1 Tax=Halorientalis litorea TaxID=2931977 RepID=UPI001FF44770|nr:3-hydroxyacyl-CoA dehydrogenase/enoyl-CoA hydratase family protein [Halorientalis litorea]
MELEDIETIAVLGAGNMGHGIAEVAALAGYDVRLRDIKEEFVQSGYEDIEWSLEKLAEKDQITDEEAEAALDSVTPLVDMSEAVGSADVIIEAVPEKMDIKKDVYAEVEEAAPDHAIFATNTSSLSITELSEVSDRPEQFCGMHFFNPPIRMQLVEVIYGGHTADETVETIEALAEDFGKTPVRVRKDSPGFIVNRILVPLMNEACWMLSDDVATVEEIDSTTKYHMGLPMGSFELADMTGIDISYHVLEYMNEVLGDEYEPAPVMVEMVENDELGQKTGKGFYDYEDGDGADVPTDEYSEEVEERLNATLAKEIANLVGDGVAPPEDIDEAVMMGAGFPQGPVKTVDEYGVGQCLDKLESLFEETGAARYEPPEYLEEAVEEGGFYGGDDEEDEGPDFEVIALERIDVDVPEGHNEKQVGHIKIDRPHRMNTISLDVLGELDEALDILEAEEQVRSILITGEGDKAFSAGADVQSMATSADPLSAQELSSEGQATFGRLEETPMPVVAGIDGFCLGGGMELSICTDIRIASERSEFGQPELDLGLLPGWGGTQRLANVIGEGPAKEIIMTAERYDAEEMEDFGFLRDVVSKDDLFDEAYELAADLAQGPPVAQKMTKRAMLKGRDDTEAGLEVESQAFGHLIGTDDVMEGMTAFMGDTEPDFEGQ